MVYSGGCSKESPVPAPFPSYSLTQFSSVQLLSCVWFFVTPWTTTRQASLSITNSWSPPKPMSIESVMQSNHLILCCPLLLLPSIFPSIRVFSNESALHIRWPKYWSFSFNISPSNEHPGLISFRMDWLDLLAVQGTLKNLLQHYSSKASILWCSAFFIIQLSHPYMTVLLGNYIILVTSSSLEQMRKPYNSLWLWKESLALGFSFMTGMACLPYQNSRLSCLPRSMCLVSQLCPTLWDPMDCTHQAPLSMGIL